MAHFTPQTTPDRHPGTAPSQRWFVPLATALVCAHTSPHAGAQETPVPGNTSAEASTEIEAPAASVLPLSVGLGWFRYSESDMRLQGPQVTLHAEHRPERPYWPDLLQADIGMGSLHYDSAQTGALSQVPMAQGRLNVLWRLGHAPSVPNGTPDTPPSGLWRAGLQAELTWTNLRGTSTTGQSGYERFNRKAWAVLQYEHPSSAQVELGVLLYGQQQSFLSQVPGTPRLPDIYNRQSRGVFVGYRHSPLDWHGLSPWVRYSDVSRSDEVGADRWYEPHNRTLQIGVDTRW